MLPFRDEQVREYLAANLGRDDAWVDGFLATIAAVHDLPDLARRPLTLRLIADQVEFIETAKLAGPHAARRGPVRRGRRPLAGPRHRQAHPDPRAQAPAHGGDRRRAVAVGQELVDGRRRSTTGCSPYSTAARTCELHYGERVPDLWKADFRTATFLKRDGDTFAFGHRSLFEYFLARYLHRALADGASRRGWRCRCPARRRSTSSGS